MGVSAAPRTICDCAILRTENPTLSATPFLTALEQADASPSDHTMKEVLSDLNWTEVQELWQKAVDRRAEDPMGAITAARTHPPSRNEMLRREIVPFLKRPVGRTPNQPIVWYHEFLYQAESWKRPRRVVAKIKWFEYGLCLGRVRPIWKIPARASSIYVGANPCSFSRCDLVSIAVEGAEHG